jgi:hypothetical protein
MPQLTACPTCGWQLSADGFREGSDRCVGCEKDAARALARPGYPQKRACEGCGCQFFAFSAWREFHSIQCARRHGQRVA